MTWRRCSPRNAGDPTSRPRCPPHARSEFAAFRFPPEVITLAVRGYLRFGLSYRDVEELLAERGIEVDDATVFRWVVRFTPLFSMRLGRADAPVGTGGSSARPR